MNQQKQAGETFIMNGSVYTAFEDGQRGLRARLEPEMTDEYQRQLNASLVIPGTNAPARPPKRLIAIGNETGITQVAADFQEQLEAERKELADYDATVGGASYRGRGY